MMVDVAVLITNRLWLPKCEDADLGHQGGGGGTLVLESWWQDTLGLVVPGQSVDSALHQNQPELGVFVLPVSLQMLPDGDCLLDKVVHILGELRGHPLPLQDTQDLVAGDEPHLGHTVTVPEDDTNLGGSQTLLGQLVDLVLYLVGGQLQPLRHRASVGQSRLGDALPWSVHTTHLTRSYNLSLVEVNQAIL